MLKICSAEFAGRYVRRAYKSVHLPNLVRIKQPRLSAVCIGGMLRECRPYLYCSVLSLRVLCCRFVTGISGLSPVMESGGKFRQQLIIISKKKVPKTYSGSELGPVARTSLRI